MIYIRKKNEPSWLAAQRAQYRTLSQMRQDTPNAARNHALWSELRQILTEEQHGLCGYCCRKITQDKAHIEHMKCQEFHPQDSLSYENLIASCDTKTTCGRYKGNNDTPTVRPTDTDCESQFSYNLYTGEIIGHTPKAEAAIDVLNLNQYSLREARYAAFRTALCYSQELVDMYLAEWPSFMNILKYARSGAGKNWEQFRLKRTRRNA